MKNGIFQKMEPGSEIAKNFHVFFGKFRPLEAYKDFIFFSTLLPPTSRNGVQ